MVTFAPMHIREPDSGRNEAPSPGGGGASPVRRRLTRFWWIVLLFLLVTIVVTIASLRDLYQLTAQERMLVGAWEWQDKPGTMVLYFDERRRLTYARPPFTAPVFEEWYIDADQRIHFTDPGRGFLKGIGRLLAPTDTYEIRFVDGTAVLTMGDGSEKVLVPYTGPAVEKLRDAD